MVATKNVAPGVEISVKSTKQELLDAYQTLKSELGKKSQEELRPEKIKEEAKKAETVKQADATAASDVMAGINALKGAIAKELSALAERMDAEAAKYRKLQEAVALKEAELNHIYEIDAAADALAALLEANKRKKAEAEEEQTQWQEAFEARKTEQTEDFERQKKAFLAQQKEERDAAEKARKREKDDFDYAWKREQEQRRNALNDEMATLEKEIARKTAESEQDAAARDAACAKREADVAERERQVAELQAKVDAFPSQLATEVAKAVKDATGKLQADFAMKEALLNKGFEGDRNVYEARLKALAETVASQSKLLESLSRQQEMAYEKVQDIATKAVASGGFKSFAPAPSPAVEAKA